MDLRVTQLDQQLLEPGGTRDRAGRLVEPQLVYSSFGVNSGVDRPARRPR